jgi:hypothetical protein
MNMYQVPIEIGGLPIGVRTSNSDFAAMLRNRYGHFVRDGASICCQLDIETIAPASTDADEPTSVRRSGDNWLVQRGDFRATWNPAEQRGTVRQSANPYSIDAVLRIIHSLVLANQGGFLLHAASAIRNGKAFLFSGVSGAGKTTISRLAPAGVTLLTDEISYVRREGESYRAYGTPFSGELAKIGDDVSAPLEALYLLAQGPENRLEELKPIESARAILRNMLFFAEDQQLVNGLFETAIEVVSRVTVRRLTFVPDQRVWDLIG